MVFSRHSVARVVAAASLMVGICAGLRPSVPQAFDFSAIQPPVPAGAISGVVRSTGGTPLARARVIVASEALAEPRVAITGADGRYTFERLPAGTYTVFASASGFASQYHRQRPNRPPPPLTLDQGQRATQIDVDLPPAGVIVGQILDEDRKPFVGATVDALVSRVENGQPTLVSVGTAISDDRGEFRLAGLPEGQYYVSAFDPAFAEVGDETGPLRYTATYYPGVSFIEEARRVSVTPGTDPKVKIVFSLKIVRPARVSGVLATPDKRQLVNGAVIMSPMHSEGLAAASSDDVRIGPDGRFMFRNVAPGRYEIRAHAETDPLGVALFATYRVVVIGRDIENVEMVLLPGAVLSGTVTYDAVETDKPLQVGGVRVRAPFANGSSFGDAVTGDVRGDGSYVIRGVMAGAHAIVVEGLAHPWVVKEILWRGQDVTDVSIDVKDRQTIDGIRITLTDVANDVAGVVRDARGDAVEGAMVLVIPLAPQFWTPTSRRFALRRTDAQGAYRVRGLPAGEYRAVASLDLDESEVYRRELLADLVNAGQPLTLGAPRRHTLDLALTSMARSKRSSGH